MSASAVFGHASRLRRSEPPPNRLQAIREAEGLTVAELARRVGVTPQAIGHLETGKRQLTVTWLKRLAAVFGCDPWSIVEEGPGPLASDERRLVEMYRRLSPPDKANLIAKLEMRKAAAPKRVPRTR